MATLVEFRDANREARDALNVQSTSAPALVQRAHDVYAQLPADLQADVADELAYTDSIAGGNAAALADSQLGAARVAAAQASADQAAADAAAANSAAGLFLNTAENVRDELPNPKDVIDKIEKATSSFKNLAIAAGVVALLLGVGFVVVKLS